MEDTKPQIQEAEAYQGGYVFLKRESYIIFKQLKLKVKIKILNRQPEIKVKLLTEKQRGELRQTSGRNYLSRQQLE